MGLCVSLCSPPPPLNSYSIKDRLTKLAVGHHNPLTLIDGYKNEPLLPLESTLRVFQTTIKNLPNQIFEAKQKCVQSSRHGLTRDESAALYLYSMGGNNDTVYFHLQSAWNSNDPYEMRPWFKYLRLLYNGVDKLPNVQGEVWQGVPYSYDELKSLGSKTNKSFTLMGSAATSVDEVENYFNEKRVDRRILIGYSQVDGKDVGGYTTPNFPSVLLYPGIKVNAFENVEEFNDGSFAFHFTKTFVKAKMKHFKCQNIRCINRCRLKHVDHRCGGFLLLSHSCSHRCGPASACRRCGKTPEETYRCKTCEFDFCLKCCFK